jgi:hypothetical protein
MQGDDIVHPLEESDTGYLSYMLRMWLRRDSNGERVWCASLQEPGSHQVESFEDISAMFAFIESRLEAQAYGYSTQKDMDEFKGATGEE